MHGLWAQFKLLKMTNMSFGPLAVLPAALTLARNPDEASSTRSVPVSCILLSHLEITAVYCVHFTLLCYIGRASLS